MTYDLVVLGGGIIGLATAWRWSLRRPGDSICLVEKERDVAFHQSGRNSGVLHSGIYYKPGSRRALDCRAGKRMIEEFCQDRGIRYELCGKVIVAVDERERPALAGIFERGQANGVACERIGPERLAELEPHARGVEAIHVPEAGIVDYPAVCRELAKSLCATGADLRFDTRVVRVEATRDPAIVQTDAAPIRGRRIANCTGLFSDRIARASRVDVDARIVPFRGEYYDLVPAARHLCRHLIYPVPDPRFPFLGVHFTRRVDGSVECGPNAVLALAREGYNWRNVRLSDLFESLTFPGFLRLARSNLRSGLGEMQRSLSKPAFVRALRKLVPEIEGGQLIRANAGVRAQALTRDGALVDDFLVVTHGRMVHVANAPSPAATASLRIGDEICDRLAQLD
ncbi:MAG TPA: L-2-hydroxyglutarate oxidase [Pirellulaceae bacterium]|jgi:L-2-hydroxyglutarate oxidase|nr:L-2-hydroxyglutarate oxidase [Pirellulaceae bacterium]